jgi:hypothetical protein
MCSAAQKQRSITTGKGTTSVVPPKNPQDGRGVSRQKLWISCELPQLTHRRQNDIFKRFRGRLIISDD